MRTFSLVLGSRFPSTLKSRQLTTKISPQDLKQRTPLEKPRQGLKLLSFLGRKRKGRAALLA